MRTDRGHEVFGESSLFEGGDRSWDTAALDLRKRKRMRKRKEKYGCYDGAHLDFLFTPEFLYLLV